jgi:competence protein ComEA
MLDRPAAGALCAIGAALALVALASIPRARVAPRSPPAPVTTTPAAVRALRDGQRIDLNRARAADLELLPGIGPSLARRIVDDREAHGAFATLDALLRVRGVGPRTLARLRDLLVVETQGEGRAQPAAAPASD